MTDDPRKMLKAAGVARAEIDAFQLAADRWEVDALDHGDDSVNAADAAILALARLVAKYKRQRDEAMDLLRQTDFWYAAQEMRSRWEEHDATG